MEVSMIYQIRSMRFPFVAACAVLLSLVAMHAAHANTMVYKYTGGNGVTVYTQALPENHPPNEVTTITIETLPVEQQRAARRMLDVMQRETDVGIVKQHSKLVEADQQINDAISRLQHAEAELQNGSVPTGNDRIGKVGGGTRLRVSYFHRVEKLQRAVDKAKLELEQAYQQRNNLR
jgi:predicted RND superfamily exporter protein